ncbi:hypothetical protein [Paraconexibacter algicola]|uniref:Uncharacterized protein n=1 Tax=Paraconexibacter algicola TaxID=2133960 RepID=A0A2T4UDV8_9ACTN|nr:hypothetical protein [Paraconexibacter algicola]PTL55691.1 hypothetical protein C7Y72_18850 [Paraconexibacter algicola]
MRLHRQTRHDHHHDEQAAPAPRPERRLRLVPDDPALAAERRMRRAGGPQDTALYHCGCGFVFDAPVTTTVRCPHCAGDLAW